MVRHAQPLWDPDGRAVSDPGLTEHGQAQAERLARALSAERFDHYYASPLRRTLETAEPVSRALGLEPQLLSWLEEIRLPPMDGQPAEHVYAYIRQARARELARWWDGLPEGESFRHFYDRVAGGIEPLLVESHRAQVHVRGGYRLWQLPGQSQRLLFVAHLGTISMMLAHLLGLEPVPWMWEQFQLDWAGIVRVRSNPIAGGAVWALIAFNQCEHLADLVKPQGPAWAEPETASPAL